MVVYRRRVPGVQVGGTRGQRLPETPTETLDIGRRVSDAMHLHILAGSVGEWMAVRLSDGSSDGIAYPSRADAIEHQIHEQLCAYLRVTPDGIQPTDAVRFIELNRALYDAGYRLADPDMPGEPIYPQTVEELRAAIRELRNGNR
jgi:hypothetical protein